MLYRGIYLGGYKKMNDFEQIQVLSFMNSKKIISMNKKSILKKERKRKKEKKKKKKIAQEAILANSIQCLKKEKKRKRKKNFKKKIIYLPGFEQHTLMV